MVKILVDSSLLRLLDMGNTSQNLFSTPDYQSALNSQLFMLILHRLWQQRTHSTSNQVAYHLETGLSKLILGQLHGVNGINVLRTYMFPVL